MVEKALVLSELDTCLVYFLAVEPSILATVVSPIAVKEIVEHVLGSPCGSSLKNIQVQFSIGNVLQTSSVHKRLTGRDGADDWLDLLEEK